MLGHYHALSWAVMGCQKSQLAASNSSSLRHTCVPNNSTPFSQDKLHWDNPNWQIAGKPSHSKSDKRCCRPPQTLHHHWVMVTAAGLQRNHDQRTNVQVKAYDKLVPRQVNSRSFRVRLLSLQYICHKTYSMCTLQKLLEQ